jgi:hypothetical protein
MELHREMVTAKSKGDSGVYDVWRIDWYNRRVYVNRACGSEWVEMDRVKLSVETGSINA